MSPESTHPLRVVIVEDDDITRESLAILLAGEPSLEVAGVFANGRELLAVVDELQADVLLTDLGLPDTPGPELIAAVKARRPLWEVLAYTISETRATVFAALRAGAIGYILKGASPRDLVEALQGVARGDAPMSPRIARMLVREFQDAPSVADDYMLTAREREVLTHLERGLSYKDVASALAISPHTVHSHIKKIYEKLHAQNRDEAVRIARLKGLV
jgi:two-component system NarL family response regulator